MSSCSLLPYSQIKKHMLPFPCSKAVEKVHMHKKRDMLNKVNQQILSVIQLLLFCKSPVALLTTTFYVQTLGFYGQTFGCTSGARSDASYKSLIFQLLFQPLYVTYSAFSSSTIKRPSIRITFKAVLQFLHLSTISLLLLHLHKSFPHIGHLTIYGLISLLFLSMHLTLLFFLNHIS